MGLKWRIFFTYDADMQMQIMRIAKKWHMAIPSSNSNWTPLLRSQMGTFYGRFEQICQIIVLMLQKCPKPS